MVRAVAKGLARRAIAGVTAFDALFQGVIAMRAVAAGRAANGRSGVLPACVTSEVAAGQVVVAVVGAARAADGRKQPGKCE